MAKNEGFAAGNNRAIERESESEWIALLNPDAIPDKNWLNYLIAAAERYPDISVFGSKQFLGNNSALIDGWGDVYHVSGSAWRDGHGQPSSRSPSECREIFSPCAAAALYKRQALLDVGGFDEDYFCYLEDIDLGFRLRLSGYKAILVPDATVCHLGGGTTGGARSDFAVYHGQRNLVWTYFKNMPWLYLWRYLLQHLVFNIVSVVFFASTGQGKVIAKAKWNALCGLPGMLKKRRAIQSAVRIPRKQIHDVMTKGWLKPYQRKSRYLRGISS
jgi:GT2 family glycosyltransferase